MCLSASEVKWDQKPKRGKPENKKSVLGDLMLDLMRDFLTHHKYEARKLLAIG